MHAHEFLNQLAAQLPEMPAQGERFMRGTHTRQMADYLHTLAQEAGMSCVCRRRRHSQDVPGQPEVTREVLYDFSWYHGAGHYALPDVVIEHENSAKPEDFLYDMWKLMAAAAPLRVIIGYVEKHDEWEWCLQRIMTSAEESDWRYPDETEDWVLLGQYGHAPSRQFEVLHRPAGCDNFRPLGQLGTPIVPPTPDELFTNALGWLRRNLTTLAPLTERDVVWSIQRHIARRIAYESLPYAIYSDYPILKEEEDTRRSRSADLVITRREHTLQMPVDLAVEFKYEPDHRRIPTEITSGKAPVIEDWKLVEKDIDRIQRMVNLHRASKATAILIDAGGYHCSRHAGLPWEHWGGATYVLQTPSMASPPQA
jgi:hypothetical protein